MLKFNSNVISEHTPCAQLDIKFEWFLILIFFISSPHKMNIFNKYLFFCFDFKYKFFSAFQFYLFSVMRLIDFIHRHISLI